MFPPARTNPDVTRALPSSALSQLTRADVTNLPDKTLIGGDIAA
jgi:hypothetical protein